MHLDKDSLIDTCKKLPIRVDTASLWEEVQSIPDNLWNEDRSPVHKDANAVFLKGFAPILNKPDDDRPILDKLPAIKDIIYNRLPGTPGKCLVATLKPRGVIPMHRDYGHEGTALYDYFKSTIRLHIPLISNEKAMMFAKNRFFFMQPGHVWALNNASDHGVFNRDDNASRCHIIVDIYPDNALLEMIKSVEPETSGINDQKALLRILKNSTSPPESPYHKAKIDVHQKVMQ